MSFINTFPSRVSAYIDEVADNVPVTGTTLNMYTQKGFTAILYTSALDTTLNGVASIEIGAMDKAGSIIWCPLAVTDTCTNGIFASTGTFKTFFDVTVNAEFARLVWTPSSGSGVQKVSANVFLKPY